MNNLKSAIFYVALILICGVFIANAGDVVLTEDGKVPGKPFEALQLQIDELRQQLSEIQVNSGIHVYDATGQHLGISLGQKVDVHNPSTRELTEIFIPSLNYSTYINNRTGYTTCAAVISFSTNDCTGPRFLYNSGVIYSSDSLGKFYVGTNVFQIEEIIAGSYLDCYGRCVTTNWGAGTYFQAVEIAEDDIPFNLPVSLPLRYEMDNE